MKDEIAQKQTNNTISINQYGAHSAYIAHAENAVTNVFTNQNSDNYDENGYPLTPLVPTRYDRSKHTIYLGNEEISIPVELESEELLSGQDLPYIHALCDVYAEKLDRIITPQSVDSLPAFYKKDLERHQQAFYGAEYVHHSMREVFADGEQAFQDLKEDAYQGIEMTYYDPSHASGYDRLRAVLDKVTSITLNRSNLVNILGMIGNLEKKGICHILVNDDVIKSWVSIDE